MRGSTRLPRGEERSDAERLHRTGMNLQRPRTFCTKAASISALIQGLEMLVGVRRTRKWVHVPSPASIRWRRLSPAVMSQTSRKASIPEASRSFAKRTASTPSSDACDRKACGAAFNVISFPTLSLTKEAMLPSGQRRSRVEHDAAVRCEGEQGSTAPAVRSASTTC